jgi:hypothetical protein
VNRGKGMGSIKVDWGTAIGLFVSNNLGELSIFKY